MDWVTVAVSLLLISMSASFVALHVCSRHNKKKTFRVWSGGTQLSRKQFVRRVQISLMLGVTGIAMLASQWLPHHPLLFGCYWLAITAWVLWILLLGLLDVFDTHRHFSKQKHDQWIQQVQQQTPSATQRNKNSCGPHPGTGDIRREE